MTSFSDTVPQSASADPPGPRGITKWTALQQFIRDPWLYPLEITRKYGDVVSIPTPFIKTVYLGHPDLVDHVLVHNSQNYRRSDMVNKQMVPPGLKHNFFAFSDDPEWRRGRTLLRPNFSQRSLAELGDLFTESVERQVNSWGAYADSGQTIDLSHRTHELALVVLFNAIFDEYLSPRALPAFLSTTKKSMQSTTVRVLMYSLPSWVPRPFQSAQSTQLDNILALADQLVETRRRHPTERSDVLNLLINATYDDGTPLENEKIAVELGGMIVGGHDTTAAALAWAFALLSTHPDIEQRVIEEVDALGGKPVTIADMARLPLVRACFDEAQRLQGGLVINPKTAVEDDEIGGYKIRAGSTILYSTLALNHDERFWPEPHRFNPDRFLNREADLKAFIPFGRGPRLCLGMRMAYIEGVLTIATAYQRYRFTVPSGYRPQRRYRMVVGLKGGLPVKITRRKSS